MKCPLTSELLPPHHFSQHIDRSTPEECFFKVTSCMRWSLHHGFPLPQFQSMFTKTSLGPHNLFLFWQRKVNCETSRNFGYNDQASLRSLRAQDDAMCSACALRWDGMALHHEWVVHLSFCVDIRPQITRNKSPRRGAGMSIDKSRQHPEVFPGGPPPQY